MGLFTEYVELRRALQPRPSDKEWVQLQCWFLMGLNGTGYADYVGMMADAGYPDELNGYRAWKRANG